VALQTAAGNRATAALVQARGCRLHGHVGVSPRSVRARCSEMSIQTTCRVVFEKFDSQFQQKLRDTGYRGSEKLVDVLNGLRNEDINAMARVGSMVSSIDADVWKLVRR